MECLQCSGYVRLIREVQDALIRAGKDPIAGYVGRFAECIDEMAQEIYDLQQDVEADGDYVPFGPEWEKEMMRWTKKELVAELRRRLT